MRSRSRILAEKSLQAMLAALEIYNKPAFAYREESFAILAINAWELLLKARILQLDGNRIAALLVYRTRQRPDGSRTTKAYRVKTRSGSSLTIGLFAAYDKLGSDYGDKLDPSLRKNLEVLCEIRDSAVHFINQSLGLQKLAQEIGAACARNYLVAVKSWFGTDLTRYNFFLMPLAFVDAGRSVSLVNLNTDEKRIAKFLTEAVSSAGDKAPGEYNVAISLELRFDRSRAAAATPVVVTTDPTATPVRLTEEDIRDKYPWDYAILTTRLTKRYADFKANQRYHDIRQPLEQDPKLCNERFLDPTTRAGAPKRFYNPNILQEFDKHYTKAG